MRPGSSLLADFYFCLGFFTRLPFPSAASRSEPHSLVTFSRAVRMLPVAGGLVGALAAIAMAAASRFGFPPPLAAPLAICSLVLLGGAMHEDGLADCADGFLGGATRERKLEIMAGQQDRHVWRRGARAKPLFAGGEPCGYRGRKPRARLRGADRSGGFVAHSCAHALGPPSARARKRSRFCGAARRNERRSPSLPASPLFLPSLRLWRARN